MVVRGLQLVGFLVVAVLAGMPLASAQQASATLVVDGPKGDLVTTRDTAIIPVNLTFTLAGVACAATYNVPFNVAATVVEHIMSGDSNMTRAKPTVDVTPAQIVFAVPAGAYATSAAASNPYRATQAIAVSVTSAGLPNITHYQGHLSVNGGSASGGPCAPAPGNLPNGQYDFSVKFNNTGKSGPTSPRVPLPWSVAPLSLALGLVLVRRRRDT